MPVIPVLLLLAFLNLLLLSPASAQGEKTVPQVQSTSFARSQMMANLVTPPAAMPQPTRAPELSSNDVMLSVHGLKPDPDAVILRAQTPIVASVDAAEVATASSHRTNATANTIQASNMAPKSKALPVVSAIASAPPSDGVVDSIEPTK